MPVSIHQGSILDSEADCIVNPANSFLQHGGGLAAIIDRAAQTYEGGDYRNTSIREAKRGQRNDAIQRIYEYKRDHGAAPLIPVGGCHATSAGMLPYRAIIHAVGPVYGDGTYLESNLLESAHQRSLAHALNAGYESIAFPAVSCGIFGYPVEEAAMLALNAAHRFEKLLAVEFWLFEQAHVDAYEAAEARWQLWKG